MAQECGCLSTAQIHGAALVKRGGHACWHRRNILPSRTCQLGQHWPYTHPFDTDWLHRSWPSKRRCPPLPGEQQSFKFVKWLRDKCLHSSRNDDDNSIVFRVAIDLYPVGNVHDTLDESPVRECGRAVLFGRVFIGQCTAARATRTTSGHD